MASIIIILLAGARGIAGQATGSSVEIITTYSQNGRYYLKSVPYDNEFPSLRGRTSVYETGRATPLYVFERGFDSVDEESNNLILSDDGETIFYALAWDADEEKEGLKSITIYRHGRIFRSYTEAEITGCDEKRERCDLLYSNYEEVVDRERSNWGTKNYKKVLKEGVSERERFLSYFTIFNHGDTVYLTDPKKRVHIFDLKTGSYTGSAAFDDIFEQIKDKARLNKTELVRYQAPIFLSFPRLADGRDTAQSLARYLGMKAVNTKRRQEEQYKWHSFRINTNILRDGRVEIEDIETHDDLPKEKIIEFFKANRFDSRSVPVVFEKWNVGYEYFFFRTKDDRLARQEKEQERLRQRAEYERRLTLETIEGIYIPRDLGECFVELDKLLSEIDRKEIEALPGREDMIGYHLTLGMWMRNNWGLWGGSRLQKYFYDHGTTNPEEMSSVILYYYYDWLKGKKAAWRDWERGPQSGR